MEVFNAMFLVRVTVKYFVETLDKLRIHEHFEMDRIAIDVSKRAPSASFKRDKNAPNDFFDDAAIGDSSGPKRELDIDPQIVDGIALFFNASKIENCGPNLFWRNYFIL